MIEIFEVRFDIRQTACGFENAPDGLPILVGESLIGVSASVFEQQPFGNWPFQYAPASEEASWGNSSFPFPACCDCRFRASSASSAAPTCLQYVCFWHRGMRTPRRRCDYDECGCPHRNARSTPSPGMPQAGRNLRDVLDHAGVIIRLRALVDFAAEQRIEILGMRQLLRMGFHCQRLLFDPHQIQGEDAFRPRIRGAYGRFEIRGSRSSAMHGT